MEFKELTLEELIQGYVRLDEEQAYQCIFCGEKFEEGLIYTSRGRSVSAHRAMQEHLFDEHGGVFESLLEMDKQVNGLSDSQKEVLEGMYRQKDNKALCEAMSISAATVRTHKFNLQKMKREARVFWQSWSRSRTRSSLPRASVSNCRKMRILRANRISIRSLPLTSCIRSLRSII